MVPSGAWLAEFVFGKIEAERWKNAAATFLSAGWAMFTVAALGYSTLVVVPDSGDGKVHVTVGPVGGGSTKQAEIGGDEVLRRPVFFPLGRSFTVRASGYDPNELITVPASRVKVEGIYVERYTRKRDCPLPPDDGEGNP